MSTNLPLSQAQLYLPNIQSIQTSEQAFGDAFLIAAQILVRHLEQIKAAIGVIRDFTIDPFNLAILGLFSKMYRNYYSYVLLEIHHDEIGSQFLIENLCDAAITLTYLLEEGQKDLFYEYVYASIHQARYFLITVEEQLDHYPNNPDLLNFKFKLETVITKQQSALDLPLTADSKAYLWGPQEANTTAKRGAVLRLNFLTNPARQIAMRVMPASWLELQLSYLNSFAKTSPTQAQPGINFTNLRDAAHLCLHASQTFLEEIVNYQGFNPPDIERQKQIFNVLYEWFHNAHNVYQMHCSATIKERDNYEGF